MQVHDIIDHKGDFFSVLGETKDSQIATMTIPPGGDSGPENLHPGDQIVYVIEGHARITIDGELHELRARQLVQIPPHAHHHIENAGEDDLFFLNVYAPPAY